MVNNNFLVPNHRKLEEAEVESLLNKYSINKNQLPKIKKKDPALKGLGAEVGDVIEITRKSFVGETKYYREVIE